MYGCLYNKGGLWVPLSFMFGSNKDFDECVLLLIYVYNSMYHKSQAICFKTKKNRLKAQLLIYHLKLCFMSKNSFDVGTL